MTQRSDQPSPDAGGNEAGREPGTRPDGEAMPPAAIDPGGPDDKGKGIPPLPEPDVEGVGEESGPSAGKTGLKGEKLGPDAAKMVKDATGF